MWDTTQQSISRAKLPLNSDPNPNNSPLLTNVDETTIEPQSTQVTLIY